jgi:hypothetical protein
MVHCSLALIELDFFCSPVITITSSLYVNGALDSYGVES